MKRLFLLTAIIFMLLSYNAYAAWTITAAIDRNFFAQGITVKITMVSDGSNPDEFNLSTYLSAEDMGRLKGQVLTEIVTDPGVAPNATYTVTIDTGLGADLVSLADRSISDTERYDMINTGLVFFKLMYDLQIDMPDIGDALDSVDMYLIFD